LYNIFTFAKKEFMKKLIFILFATILFNACNVGYNKDFMTGLEVSYKGLSSEEIFLTANGRKLSTNEVGLNTDLVCFFQGVRGYQLNDNLAYIGASMILTDSDGNELLNEADLFSYYDDEGLTPEDLSSLSLSLTTGSPMEVGEEYNLQMKIWDKKGTGEINASVSLKIK